MSHSVIIVLASPLSWIYWTLVALYGATVLAIVGVVLSENRNPVLPYSTSYSGHF